MLELLDTGREVLKGRARERGKYPEGLGWNRGLGKAWDVELGVETYQEALRTDTPLPTMGTLGPVRYSPLNSHYIPTQITQSHLSAT